MRETEQRHRLFYRYLNIVKGLRLNAVFSQDITRTYYFYSSLFQHDLSARMPIIAFFWGHDEHIAAKIGSELRCH
jgi:hypothetical protein